MYTILQCWYNKIILAFLDLETQQYSLDKTKINYDD